MTTTQKTEPVVEDKIDANTLANSLTGFDQLAIQKYFTMRFDQLSEDPLMFLRALWFVTLTRGADKPKAVEAFRGSMELSMADLTSRFETAQKVDGYDDNPDDEADEGFASFIVGTGLNYTFAQYMELTVHQRAKILDAARKKNRRR